MSPTDAAGRAGSPGSGHLRKRQKAGVTTHEEGRQSATASGGEEFIDTPPSCQHKPNRTFGRTPDGTGTDGRLEHLPGLQRMLTWSRGKSYSLHRPSYPRHGVAAPRS